MNIFIIFLIAIALVCTQDVQNDEQELFIKYQEYLKRYNKTYSTSNELNERFSYFLENYRTLQKIRNETEIVTMEKEEDRLHFGVTPLFDLSEEEYERQYLSYSISEEHLNQSQTPTNDTYAKPNQTELDVRHLQQLGSSFDWRNHGVVGPVKNQGGCGVCYAFAVAGNLEGLYAIKYGILYSFSEQQILNCDYTNYGCNGGVIANTYDYLSRTNGLGLTSNLPYTQFRQYCYNIPGVARVVGKQFAGSTSSTTIASFLMSNGPLAAGVNASYFKYYQGGVFNLGYECSSQINHAVTIVGYGITSSGTGYWIIKNSWGVFWGENGYIRLSWGTCGINSYVLSGIIA